MDFFVIKKNGERYGIKLLSSVFDVRYNEILLHQFIVSFLANSHFGVKKHKSRGLVSGGGKKPWKQKGSGRARVGSIRSPLWRGGGKIFAAKGLLKSKKKINKKVYKLGMKIIFSELIRSGRLNIIDDFKIDAVKTKFFVNAVSHLELFERSLFVFSAFNLDIYLASRNIKDVFVMFSERLNPVMLLKFRSVFITLSAIRFMENFLKC